jgi:hypothetical protein
MALGFGCDLLAVAAMAGAIATTSGSWLALALALGNVVLVGGTLVAYRGWSRLDDDGV